MENLKGLIFKAKRWDDSTKTVEGELTLLDFKTLDYFDPQVNRNGYLMAIIDANGKNLIQPDTVELITELSEDLQQCEGCSGKWPYDEMESDCEGVPLCKICYDELVQEALARVCKGCQLKGSEFKPGQEWVNDDYCSNCSEE